MVSSTLHVLLFWEADLIWGFVRDFKRLDRADRWAKQVAVGSHAWLKSAEKDAVEASNWCGNDVG